MGGGHDIGWERGHFTPPSVSRDGIAAAWEQDRPVRRADLHPPHGHDAVPAAVDRAFEGLKRLAGDHGWTALLAADLDDLDDVLRPLGFVNRRREQLLEIARRVQEDHDGSLDPLTRMSDEGALGYLTSLPGVGVKTAKCVLMYSLGRDVVPVDIHVLRVAKRLGLVAADATWDQVDHQLEVEVPDELKFDLHVQLVIHGREICKSRNPQCDDCVLLDVCPTGHLAPTLRSDYVR